MYVPTEEAVVALSMATGEVQWRTDVGESPSSPALVDGRLLVTTRDGKLVALGFDRGVLDGWGTEIMAGLGTGLAGLGGYAAYRRLRDGGAGTSE